MTKDLKTIYIKMLKYKGTTEQFNNKIIITIKYDCHSSSYHAFYINDGIIKYD